MCLLRFLLGFALCVDSLWTLYVVLEINVNDMQNEGAVLLQTLFLFGFCGTRNVGSEEAIQSNLTSIFQQKTLKNSMDINQLA